MSEWWFRPWFCSCKAILGREQLSYLTNPSAFWCVNILHGNNLSPDNNPWQISSVVGGLLVSVIISHCCGHICYFRLSIKNKRLRSNVLDVLMSLLDPAIDKAEVHWYLNVYVIMKHILQSLIVQSYWEYRQSTKSTS